LFWIFLQQTGHIECQPKIDKTGELNNTLQNQNHEQLTPFPQTRWKMDFVFIYQPSTSQGTRSQSANGHKSSQVADRELPINVGN